MLKEEYLQQLLKAIYDNSSMNVYDYTASIYTTESEIFVNLKSWVDELVRNKLANYADEEHTDLQITNFGKYWMLKGGYEMYLRDGQNVKDRRKTKTENKVIEKEKEDLIEARLKLTHYRLVGFWLTVIISSVGFLLSLYNLYLIMMRNK